MRAATAVEAPVFVDGLCFVFGSGLGLIMTLVGGLIDLRPCESVVVAAVLGEALSVWCFWRCSGSWNGLSVVMEAAIPKLG